MILFDVVSEPFHRSPFSGFAVLIPSTHKMTKRSRFSIDEVSKFEVRHREHDYILQIPAGIQKSQNQERQHRMSIIGFQKEHSRVHRLHRDATMLKIPLSKYRVTDVSLS